MILENGVTAIEWAEKIPDNLPEHRIDIHIEMSMSQQRRLLFTACGQKEQDVISQIKTRVKEIT